MLVIRALIGGGLLSKVDLTTLDNHYLKRESSLIVDKNNFLTRLISQLYEIFNRKFTERLRSAYHSDPIEFIVLSLLLVPIPIIFLILVLFLVSITLFGDSPITKIFGSYLLGFLGILMFLLLIGSFLFAARHRDDDLEKPGIAPIKDSPIERKIKNKAIFVVHGHDPEKKNEVVGYLRELKLSPIVLQDEPNRGKTIIEKVEFYVSQTSFAIVLLTKDDFGISKEDFDVNELKKISETSNFSINQTWLATDENSRTFFLGLNSENVGTH